MTFFDFSDAFGSVDRIQLLQKVKEDFGIQGKLLNHIVDFLNNRTARIRINKELGQWKDSCIGTSAGTFLGPILFLTYVHDIPWQIRPKFADDVTAIAIENSMPELEASLQEKIDIFCGWCTTSGMTPNFLKTKVMNFSEGIKEHKCQIA